MKGLRLTLPDSLVDAGCRQLVSADDMNLDNPYIAEIFSENPGFYFVGEPEKWSDDVTAVCRKCNTRMTYFASYFRKTISCTYCGRKSGTSLMECLMLAAFQHKAGKSEVIRHDRDAIGLELDVYLPDQQFAVEPGGWVFHKSSLQQEKDCQKRVRCEAQGIRLITIYDACQGRASSLTSGDVWAYDICLAQEQGMTTLKRIINRLLGEAGFEAVAEREWSDLIAQAQHSSGAITQDEFVNRVAARNLDYEVIGRYVNKNTPVEMLCKRHGMKFSAAPFSLYKGIGCPECHQELVRISNEEFQCRVYAVLPDIEILSDYDGTANPVKCRCRHDGHEWAANAGMLMQGHGCPVCARRKTGKANRRDWDDVLAEIHAKHPQLSYVSGYESRHVKATFRCDQCGHIWAVTPHNLLTGSSCPQYAQASRVALHTLSDGDFKQRIAELYPGYEVVSEYTGYTEPVTLRCPHGHLHTLQATTFLNHRNIGLCPQCKGAEERDDIDEETLRREYLDEHLTIAQICERHNRSNCYVRGRMEKYGIKPCPMRRMVAVDRDELYRLYVEEKTPVSELEKHFGCSKPTLYKYMREYGIEKRCGRG